MSTEPRIPMSPVWPALPVKEWEGTRATLHMWMQIVGKIRMAMTPHVNHWWEVPLYVDVRGLTTSPIPSNGGILEIRFDFLDDKLLFQASDRTELSIDLKPRTVAAFYAEVLRALQSMNINVKIWPMPVEIPNPIRFDRDDQHSSYDPEYANRFWRALVAADAVLKEFRARYIGKVSPVHFFWGSFDLAVSRFSGRRAPERPGADAVTREAYSHELISAGFWPGSGDADAAFYAYAAPEPPGFPKAAILPKQAFYSTQLSEYLLMYEEVRKAASPKGALLDFFQSTYDAGASLGNWDRESLERPVAS